MLLTAGYTNSGDNSNSDDAFNEITMERNPEHGNGLGF